MTRVIALRAALRDDRAERKGDEMAAMMGPRVDVTRFTRQDLAAAEHRQHRLQALRAEPTQRTTRSDLGERLRLRFRSPALERGRAIAPTN